MGSAGAWVVGRLGRARRWPLAALACLAVSASAAHAGDERTTAKDARVPALEAASKADPGEVSKERELAAESALLQANEAAGLWPSGRYAPAPDGVVDDTEPNNTAGTATALLFGTNPVAVAVGGIQPIADLDFYSFSAPAGSRVWAYVDTGGVITGAGRDSQVRIFDTDGTTEIQFDDDDGTGNGLDGTVESGLASVIAGFPLTTGGTYYVRVNEFGNNGTIIPYRLYVTVTTSSGAEIEPNDTANQSNSLLPVTGAVFGFVTPRTGDLTAGDADYYFVHALAGEILYLALDGNPERDGTNLDADLALIDTNGTTVLLEVDSDSGNPLGEGFAYTIPATGTYYVRVRDIGATATGTYAVMAARVNGSACVGAGKGNFDNLFGADLIFRNQSSNRNVVWAMDGVTRTAGTFITPDPLSADWRVAGSDDFDSDTAPGCTPGPICAGPDGQTDLVFYNVSTGEVEFWLLDGTNRPGAVVPLTGAAPLPLNWKLSATGDFNQDGHPDIVWRNFTSQKIVIWTMGEGGNPPTQKTGNITPSPDQAVDFNWEIVAALDFNNDNSRDFLWYNVNSGRIVTWYMNASVVRITGQFTTPAQAGDFNWKVVAGGDYSWNYQPGTPPFCSPDVVWRNDTSGNVVVWHMNFSSTRVHGEFTKPPAPANPLDWRIVGPK